MRMSIAAEFLKHLYLFAKSILVLGAETLYSKGRCWLLVVTELARLLSSEARERNASYLGVLPKIVVVRMNIHLED